MISAPRNGKRILLPSYLVEDNVRDYIGREMGATGDDLEYSSSTSSSQPGAGMPPPCVDSGSSGSGSSPIEDIYFMLDSVDKVDPSPMGGVRFDVTRLNGNKAIDGAVKIKIGAFHVPNILLPPNRAEYHYYKYVYIRIDELSSTQGVMITPSKYYHFRMHVENTNSTAVRLVPEDDIYYLTRPFSAINTITLSFIMPHDLRPMRILNDVVMVIPLAGSTDTYEIVGDGSTQDIFPHSPLVTPYPITLDNEPANMVEVAVFMSGLSHPDFDFSTAVNSPEGVIAKTIIDDKRFTIDVVAPSAWLPGEPPSKMIIAKNRISVPIRVTCSRSMPTNNLMSMQV